MSIKYGESKRQYVKGKSVKNLSVYVDKECVNVDWDEIGDDMKCNSKSLENLSKYLEDELGIKFSVGTQFIFGREYVILTTEKYIRTKYLKEIFHGVDITRVEDTKYGYLINLHQLKQRYANINGILEFEKFDLLKEWKRADNCKFIYEIVRNRLESNGITDVKVNSWDDSTVLIELGNHGISEIQSCLNVARRYIVPHEGSIFINFARMREIND